MPTHRDKNHNEVANALKNRCGGYWKDKELGHHYAYLHGIHVAAYDMHSRGAGYPDWEVWVGWLGMLFEVKEERKIYSAPKQGGGRRQRYKDKEFYSKQLEETEKVFGVHHPGLIAIVSEQNQIYEWLCAMVDFVEYIEGKSTGSEELLRLFFPGRLTQTPEPENMPVASS